jgi:hypothetical protein
LTLIGFIPAKKQDSYILFTISDAGKAFGSHYQIMDAKEKRMK